MILRGDCVEVMAGMDAGSVDAIVTDPPYGLGFMGKQWDELPPGPEFAERALRVLKPGGHLLAFGGTRTYHRLTVAIEDAGFEIRDCLSWLYGSGFPKSLDVSKAIDKAAGAEREVVGRHIQSKNPRKPGNSLSGSRNASLAWASLAWQHDITAPATEDAARWEGFGTALKPSWEPIIMARKPLTGTVAANVLEHGTGALNIDGCRIGYESEAERLMVKNRSGAGGPTMYGGGKSWKDSGEEMPSGRWPANTVLDEQAAAILDEQVGERPTGDINGGAGRRVGAEGRYPQGVAEGYKHKGDTGGPSRFFYVAKASRKERNAGLDGFEEREGGAYAGGTGMPGRTQVNGEWVQTDIAQRRTRANVHPTVKPIALMRWLVRMVTPPEGTVLDPFTGSGTTGCAAVLEGFNFIGIEREAEYADIAEARIKHWTPDQLALT